MCGHGPSVVHNLQYRSKVSYHPLARRESRLSIRESRLSIRDSRLARAWKNCKCHFLNFLQDFNSLLECELPSTQNLAHSTEAFAELCFLCNKFIWDLSLKLFKFTVRIYYKAFCFKWNSRRSWKSAYCRSVRLRFIEWSFFRLANYLKWKSCKLKLLTSLLPVI